MWGKHSRLFYAARGVFSGNLSAFLKLLTLRRSHLTNQAEIRNLAKITPEPDLCRIRKNDRISAGAGFGAEFRYSPSQYHLYYTVVQKNAPTLADYNYDPVQSILIIFSKLFVNDHKSCLVVKFSTSPHICCHYTL